MSHPFPTMEIPRPTSPDFSIISPPSPTHSQLHLPQCSTPTPSWFPSRKQLAGMSTLHGKPIRSILPRLWDALSSPVRRRTRFGFDYVYPDFDYADLMPLDGEEGELIDDEACFIDVRAVTGIDIITALPPELSLHLLSFLDLSSILSCLGVCKSWRALAGDNTIWRGLFERTWRVDLTRVTSPNMVGRCDLDWLGKERTQDRENGVGKFAHAIEEWSRRRLTSQAHSIAERYSAVDSRRSSVVTVTNAARSPLRLNWRHLYRTRYALDQRWAGSVSALASASSSSLASESVVTSRIKQKSRGYDPVLTRLSGHGDSVYCLEFDSRYIITGSRDRSIKVWEVLTGRCVGTFAHDGRRGGQGHRGSVLCLKFEREWHRRKGARGFMVSGSSDCSICVWEIWVDELEGKSEVKARVRKVLRGHSGGVLDLRICEKWIVSCSKDTLIHVWNRHTLHLHCTFRGHQGPVNAVGKEGSKVVSASGDGKMMLWDIPACDGSGGGEMVCMTPLRVFEGHDRGLACIEFKDDIIVSGSNDCKIKVWRASTGECLRTLHGHESLVRALSFCPRSGRLVSASYDKTVKVWDLETGRLVREFRGCHGSHIFDVKFDVGRIVSTSHDQKIVILDFTQDLDTELFV